jgi:two-component system chemotaxis response regulator CheY
MGKKILVIDDEENILDAIKIILEEMEHSVDIFSDPRAGERQALDFDYDLIITDLRMPIRNGAEIAKAVLAKKKDAKILVITAYAHDNLVAEALNAGAVGMLRKPFEIAKILSFLKE